MSDETLARFVAAVVDDARLVERLRSTMVTLKTLGEAIGEVNSLDHELAPELMVAVEHLAEIGDALGRALAFVSARSSARHEQILREQEEE